MKNQKEIEKEIINILGENSDGLSYDIRDVDRCASDIFSLLQSEKDKWKAKMLEIIGEDEDENSILYGASQAFIHRNQLRQQLRERLKKL